MSTQPSKKQDTMQLEDSKLWQLSKVISGKIREAVKTVPYQEYYVFANPAIQNATLVTSDIAFALGKGKDAAAFDYRYARGHLFTLKGLLLVGQEAGFVQESKDLMINIEKLQTFLEKEIAVLEKKEEITSNKR